MPPPARFFKWKGIESSSFEPPGAGQRSEESSLPLDLHPPRLPVAGAMMTPVFLQSLVVSKLSRRAPTTSGWCERPHILRGFKP